MIFKQKNQNSNSRVLKGSSISEIETLIIESFDADKIDVKPKTEKELLLYYAEYTDILFQYLRVIVDEQLFYISNEIRALLGHLSDYRVYSDITKNNLEKAYGHFRRMNLDAFKTLCDMFDDALSRQLRKDYTLDYREVSSDYLEKFSQMYFSARESYLEAQTNERTGSDSHVHNILGQYYIAIKKYIELKQYYMENKSDIKRIKRKVIFSRIIASVFGAISLFSCIIEYI